MVLHSFKTFEVKKLPLLIGTVGAAHLRIHIVAVDSGETGTKKAAGQQHQRAQHEHGRNDQLWPLSSYSEVPQTDRTGDHQINESCPGGGEKQCRGHGQHGADPDQLGEQTLGRQQEGQAERK